MSDDGDGSTSNSSFSLARRRSKNRVNARLSRERKRLVLNTLQQEYWKLHQENMRVKGENDKIREAISSIKITLLHQEREKAPPKPSRPANLLTAGLLGGFPMQGLQEQQQQKQPVVAPPGRPDGKSIVELLAQHLAVQGSFPNDGGRHLQFAFPAPTQPQRAPPAHLRAFIERMSSDEMNQQIMPFPMPFVNSQSDPSSNDVVVVAALGILLSSGCTQSDHLAVLLEGLGNVDGIHGFQKAGSAAFPPFQAQLVDVGYSDNQESRKLRRLL
jgi:hypothetical protein